MKTLKSSLGWKPDLPDFRDHIYTPPKRFKNKLPPRVDLRENNFPNVYTTQGDLGSCTANAIGAAFQYAQRKAGQEDFIPSRLFIYYNERVIEKTIGCDNGAQIRNGIKSLNKIGVCPETMWQYDYKSMKFAKKPGPKCYQVATNNQLKSYKRLNPVLAELKACLASGYPFIFGFTIFDGFLSDKVKKTGILNMPVKSKESVQGGHAVLAVGYDDRTQRFIIRNSWGNKWGDKGYFTMPYKYVTSTKYSEDFWTIRTVE